MRITLMTSALLLLVNACATHERIATTRSGRPEATIAASKDETVSSLIIAMQRGGFMLAEQTDNSVLFTKPMSGLTGAFAQVLIGNSYSTTPQIEVRYVLSEIGESIRAVAFLAMSTQMAFGQINRQDMRDNNAWFNDVQGVLNQVRVGAARGVNININNLILP